LGAFCFLGEFAKEFSKIAGDVKGSIFNKLRWKLQFDQEEFVNVFFPKMYESFAFLSNFFILLFEVLQSKE
jgi:hypothetical protein